MAPSSPERVAGLRAAFGLPILKAIALDEKSDLLRAEAYKRVADKLLFDAKPPKHATAPGGNGLAFDWMLLRDYAGQCADDDWFLSGGLTAENVGEAIRLTGAPGVGRVLRRRGRARRKKRGKNPRLHRRRSPGGKPLIARQAPDRKTSQLCAG